MRKPLKYAVLLFITLLLVGSYMLLRWFTLSNGRYAGNRPRIEIVNNFTDINIAANTADLYELMDKTGFLSGGTLVFDDLTIKKYQPASIVLIFEEMTDENPGYIVVFNAKGQRVYGYARDVSSDSYTLTYYLDRGYFHSLDSNGKDSNIEELLKKSFIYLGKVSQKKARLTEFESREVYKVLLTMSGKYDLINIEKN
jgi:hypothetical protein